MGDMNGNFRLYGQKLSYRSNAAPCQCLAQPWFIRAPHRVYGPRHGNRLEPLICGEEVFKSISENVSAAQHTVDIITWGFDPGMVLVRGATAEAGVRYGDLLKTIATRKKNPVKVRLLVWHDDAAAQKKMNNAPGYYGRLFPGIGSADAGFYSESHQTFNAEWYEQACSNAIPNLHFHVRAVPFARMWEALKDETLPEGLVSGGTGLLAAVYPAHHQKMVLIDYEAPDLAVGYVMGHNSITDFWDTKEHLFRDPRRERIYTMNHVALQKAAWKEGQCYDTPASGYVLTERQQADKERLVQSYIDKHSRVSKPYQDVSCRLQGPVLHDLNHNFCQAWQESERPSSLFLDICRVVPASTLRLARAAARAIGDIFHSETDPSFIERRAKIPPSAFNLRNGEHSVQLVRTQPMHGEKGAKECYANLTRQMLHYMFIQNQYIQYVTWAEHLVACVGRLRSAGYLQPIYVFILTSTPERAGMDSPTYEVANKVGSSDAMKVEHHKALEDARKRNTQPPITAAELADHGIHVFMGSLWTCAESEGPLKQSDYEEIYIHTKVAVVDDAAFTIGSANLNLRSMAMDSELNILSQAQGVAFQLRCDLFSQCTGNTGPAQFGNMKDTFRDWKALASKNEKSMKKRERLDGQLLGFHVDRNAGSPLI